MVPRCSRQVAAPVDEDVVVEEGHVARRGWTSCQLPIGVVRRRGVQRGVQNYDASFADLRAEKKRKFSSRNRNVTRGIRRGDFRLVDWLLRKRVIGAFDYLPGLKFDRRV